MRCADCGDSCSCTCKCTRKAKRKMPRYRPPNMTTAEIYDWLFREKVAEVNELCRMAGHGNEGWIPSNRGIQATIPTAPLVIPVSAS